MFTYASPVYLCWPIRATCIATSCIIDFGIWPFALQTKRRIPINID